MGVTTLLTREGEYAHSPQPATQSFAGPFGACLLHKHTSPNVRLSKLLKCMPCGAYLWGAVTTAVCSSHGHSTQASQSHRLKSDGLGNENPDESMGAPPLPEPPFLLSSSSSSSSVEMAKRPGSRLAVQSATTATGKSQL